MRLSLNTVNFSALQRVLNDSVDAGRRGVLNGLLTTISSIFQALGPTVGGIFVAWSMNNGLGFPFNHYFVSTSCAVLCFIVLKECALRIDAQKILINRMLEVAGEIRL